MSVSRNIARWQQENRQSLTQRELEFVDWYMLGLSPYRIAKKMKITGPAAYKYLKDNKGVQEEIERRFERRAAITKGEIVERLADQARGDMGAFLHWRSNEDRAPEIAVPEDTPTHLIRKYVKTSKRLGAKLIEERIEIELYDAQKALEILGKHLGMFRPNVAIQNNIFQRLGQEPMSNIDVTAMSDDELHELLAAFAQADTADGVVDVTDSMSDV